MRTVNMERLKKWVQELNNIETPELKEWIYKELGPFPRVSLIYANFEYPWLVLLHVTVITPMYLLDTCCLAYSLFLLVNELTTLIFALHFLLIYILAVFITFYTAVKRGLMTEVMTLLRCGFYDYKEEKATDEDERSNIYKEFRKLRLLFMTLPLQVGILVIVVLMRPTIDKALGVESRGLYSEIGINDELIMPIYYPFSSNETLTYLATFGLQTLVIFQAGSVIMSADLMVVTAAITICSEIEMLILSLRQLEDRARMLYETRYNKKVTGNSENGPKFKECLHYCFVQNVEHHKAILLFVKSFHKVAGAPLFLGFVIGTLIVGLSTVNMSLTDSTLSSQFIIFVAAAEIELYNLFVICYFGEVITSLSERLNYEIFCLDWTKLDERMKNSIIIFQDGTRAPILISPLGLFQCNFETFKLVVNKAYSVYNLLSVSKK